MWLKLTPLRHNDQVFIIDSQDIKEIYTDSDGDTCVEFKDDRSDTYVKEGLDDLLAILNKTEIQSSNPRERNVIGQELKDYWDKEGR